MSNPVAPQVAEGEEDRPAPPFDPAVVEEVLRLLDKTVRAHQLYAGNEQNPSYIKTIDGMRAGFVPLWENTGSITLLVSDTQFTWFGVPVHVREDKAGDSLPWTLYKDGLRELTITSGFEGGELDKFLAVIPRVRQALPHDDDLLTILWEQEFAHLSYQYVELAQDGAPIDPSAEPGKWPVAPGGVVEQPMQAIEDAQRDQQRDQQREQAAAAGGGAAEETPKRSGIVSMDDFDSALYFLEENEVQYLKTELVAEYDTDLRRVVLDALLDIFELQVDPLVRKEVAGHVDALILHLLAGSQFGNVAYLLRETSALLERARELQPDTRDLISSLADRLSEPTALTNLLQALDESDSLPPKDDLELLFVQLRPTGLGTIFAWLGQTRNLKLRPVLEGAADRLAASHTGEVVRLIASADGNIAMEAVRRAGALRTGAAVGALGKALAEPYRELRVAAVTALVDIGTPGAMQALEKAIDDADRDVRITAIRAIAARVHKPALARVTQAVKAKEIRDADRTERLAMFELFGLLCGDPGVPFLDDLLNGKSGLFSRKEDPEFRACAAVALGKIGTARALQALQKAAAEKDAVVRTAVNRALRIGVP